MVKSIFIDHSMEKKRPESAIQFEEIYNDNNDPVKIEERAILKRRLERIADAHDSYSI